MRKAQLLGGLCAVLVMSGWILWRRTRPLPCPGGVTVEFHPPLMAPGPYHFALALDPEQGCEFDVPMPPTAQTYKTHCPFVLEMKTQRRGQELNLAGLTFAAHPASFRLKVLQAGKPVYNVAIEPRYAPYETLRAEDRLFCGERAWVSPPCLRGSAQCAPYPAGCDGPEDCATGQVCCATPEWGRDYGVKSAVECTSRRNCLDRYAHIACHADADCPPDMTCSDATVEAEFRPKITACAAKPLLH